MEDINIYLITLRQQIEIEYYKLKNNNVNIEINQIIESIDNLNKSISVEEELIENIKSNNLFLTDSYIEKLLIDYEDGTYGILNYMNSLTDDKLIEHIINNKYEYNNKPTIINKLITNNKFSMMATTDSYGVLFLYMKDNTVINSLHKIHLLKNNSIQYLNEDEDDNEKLITKIYEFGDKITLKDAIYSSNFDTKESTQQYEEKLNKLLIEKKQLEPLYKLVKKYNKYIDDNIDQIEIKTLYLNFSFVNMLIKKLKSNTITKLNIDQIIKFNYTDLLDRIKISNRLEQSDYDTIIERYFDLTIDDIINNTLINYNLNSNFRPYLNILFEILIRLYIDNHLEYKSFCLSKSLLEYLKFSNLLSDPETNTTTLKRRHWNQLLETKDNKKIISSLLYLIKTKTNTIENTFKYFESIYKEIKIKY